MALLFTLLAVLFTCWPQGLRAADKTSLSGVWHYQLDPADIGITGQWFGRSFLDSLTLPGTLPEQGIGDDIVLYTHWTGDLTDSWFLDPKYEPYRKENDIKVSFFLQPNKHYVGPAWYQREIEIPQNWDGMDAILFLERVHWGTMVWVDGVAFGGSNSLGTPHTYDLGRLTPGSHILSIRVDNRLVIDVGVNASSVTDHTQGNWNGVVGEMSLSRGLPVRLEDIQVYPHLSTRSITVKGTIANPYSASGTGTVAVTIAPRKQPETPLISVTRSVSWTPGSSAFSLDLNLGPSTEAWDEFAPALFDLTSSLTVGTNAADSSQTSFGLREITTEGTQFVLNGHKIFLRGTLECCIFPNSGYPPTDTASWLRIISIAKSFGLNLIRFHSWCPPEAAFRAADESGFYFQVECETWTHPGEGSSVDDWLYIETERILKSYGNHPSFLLMTSGNEPAGSSYAPFLNQWVNHFKAEDSRRLFTSASGWPQVDANQFHVSWEPRIQWTGAGLSSPYNAQPPRTDLDFRWYTGLWKVPVISHEIGEWCAYPNFDEIPKYTNYLKPKNLEIFRDFLDLHQMKELAKPFLMASGKLQVICYKEEIERALRTPGMGGFELLDLHDFPGQGTALVGVLDAFWDEKGYVTAGEYRRFCNSTVPLARLSKRVFSVDENLDANLEVAHFGPVPLTNVVTAWSLVDGNGIQAAGGTFPAQTIPIGNGTSLGSLNINLSRVPAPARYKLVVGLSGTGFTNDWDVWIYPSQLPAEPENAPIITRSLTPAILSLLTNGARVLLTVPASASNPSMGRVKLGFSSIFWNTDWTHNQSPTTLGILCDPSNPLFRHFPTDYHSNWQWWYLLTGAEALVLDDLPADLTPTVRNIDDWFTARRLGMVFEGKVGRGKLMVCSVNIENGIDANIVARQFRQTLLEYMASEDFNPVVDLSNANLAPFSETPPVSGPKIVQNAVSAIRPAGHPLTLEAIVDGTPPLAYTWSQNGKSILSNISLVPNISITIPRADLTNAGIYSLQITNAYGSAVSPGVNVEIIDSPEGSYLNSVADLGPIAYWDFDHGNNARDGGADLAGNFALNHSNINIEQGLAPPVYLGFAMSNKAGAYNGITSGSEAPTLFLSQLKSFTLAGWVNPNLMPQRPGTVLLGQEDFAGLGFYSITNSSEGVLGFWVASPTERDNGFRTMVICTNTQSLIPPGKWFFVTATADGTNAALYVNGKLVSYSSAAEIQDHYASTSPFRVGFETKSAPSHYFGGLIDEVAVFDRALSQSSIGLLYARAVEGGQPRINIQVTNGQAIVDWHFGTLEAAGAVSGIFTNVPRAVAPFTNLIGGNDTFFRVKAK